MTTFYICRHGETENNKNKRLSGWIDTPLTEEGVNNAISSASKLKGIQLDAVISSDLGRAFVTAYIIVKRLDLGLTILRNKKLREMNYGDLANKPISLYPSLTPIQNATYTPPNGESLNDMQLRVMNEIAKISDEHRGKTILIVAHDGTINTIRASFESEDMGNADSIHNSHDSVFKFTYSDKVKSYQLFA